MKLHDLDKKDFAKKALEEQYKMNMDFSNLSLVETTRMLKKVRTLAMETKKTAESYDNFTNPSYMKLVFLEEALVNHFNQLSHKRPRIVVENEEVEKSQVVLAAQDMVDTVQKMIENVSDMLVKELPALTDSIQSEIGNNESQSFNEQVSGALKSLQETLTQSQNTLKSALGTITGEQGEGFDTEPEMPDMEPEMPGGEGETVDVEFNPAPEEAEVEEPELPPLGGAGRPKR